MNQKIINIILIVSIAILLFIVVLQNEKSYSQNQQIDYKKYKQAFNELQDSVNTLRTQVVKQDVVIDKIKIKIISDEQTIRNASNYQIDSIFNTMVSRQHKSVLQRP